MGVEGLDVPIPPLRPSHTVGKGERVYFVGGRLQLGTANLTILEGSISRVLPFKQAKVFDTNLDIWMGSEGGGIFDSEGRLVGIAAWFALEGRQWTFAVPAEWISPREGHVVISPSEKDFEVAEWHAVVWKEIGLSFFAAGDPASARRAYQRAIDCDSSDAFAWYSAGLARSMSKEFEEAITAYNEAVRLEPSLAIAWSGLGDAYVAVGQDAKAIEAYENAVKYSSKDFRAWDQMGWAYERLGQVEKAMLAHERANQLESDPANDDAPGLATFVEVNPQNAEAWHALGQTHARMKRHKEAIRAFRRSLDLNPLSEKVWFDLGNAYFQLKDYVQA
ncbi:MAG: tetratricopeptide repeat-containing S1 family peptidase, partial [Terriglobia bacterium]